MASLAESVAVSDSGEYLAHSSSDGRLKLWDTSTGRLKQEYTPSAHLSAKCTCLSWGPTRQQAFAAHKKKKRQKTTDDAGDALSEASLLAMGTAEGTVLLYSLARGDLHSELTGGHTATVNGVSWHASSDSLFSVSDDQHIVHWSVSSCKVKSKWKADRHSVYAVAAVDANTVLTASSSIKWWNIDTKSIVMKFTGHVTEVRHILPVFVPSKDGEERTYFLTCAANDRQVSAWHLEKGAGSSSLANFVLSEEAVHISVSHSSENNKMAHLSAVTKSGALHIFELQLNGRCKTPMQPNFEHLSIAKDLREQTWLVRKVKPAVSFTVEDGISQVKQPVKPTREVTSLAPGHLAPSAGKRKVQAGSMGQLPMEERLLAVTQASGKEPPRADNLSQLLLQGLQSEDPRLLNSVLQRTDETLLRNTVRRLPLSSVLSLLKELQQRMHSRGSGVYPYMKWTKTVVSTHTSYLMTCKEANTLLNPLLELLEARTEMFEKVCRLRGKVDLIMAQVATRHEDVELPTEPLCVVNDDSSDDDMDQDAEHSDDEREENNMWELSDGDERSRSEADDNSAMEDGEADSVEGSSQDEDEDDCSDIA
ncbi:hypothetical protein MRX96_040957 [Rhipicephalus microplus]